MIIRTIELKDFRNYETLAVELSPGVNILVGKNAQGKTNLLEAVGYASTGRSHRTSYDKECVRMGCSDAYIKVLYYNEKQQQAENARTDSVEIHLRRNGNKSVAINRMPAAKINDLFGCIRTVLFSPEDLSLIKEGPAKRRRFMDMEICQVDKVYLYYLQQYQKLLRQRNELLKSEEKTNRPPDLSLVQVLNEQFAQTSLILKQRRNVFIGQLMETAPPLHLRLSGGTENITFSYDTNLPDTPEEIIMKLDERWEQDLKTGSTSVGPHRDDIEIDINGDDVRIYGSQGQKRTAALSMKLAEVEMMEKETGTPPILLLDDVMSELDESRQQLLVRSIEGRQTVITCTGVEDSLRKMDKARIFRVEKGTILA